jgi:hypothetical protein
MRLAGVSGARKHFTFLLLEPKQLKKDYQTGQFLPLPVQYVLKGLPPHFVKQVVQVSLLYLSNERCPLIYLPIMQQLSKFSYPKLSSIVIKVSLLYLSSMVLKFYFPYLSSMVLKISFPYCPAWY